MVKKLISVALCFSIIFSISPNALATIRKEEPQDNIIYRNDTVVTPATPELMSEYKKFEIQLPEGQFLQNNSSANSIKNMILSMCTEIKTEQVGGKTISTYSASGAEKFLTDCSEITSVSTIDELLYICYRTTENRSVTLCYNSQGLFDKVVYDEESDAAYHERSGAGVVYENFRTGTGYTVVESEDASSQGEAFTSPLEVAGTESTPQQAATSSYFGFQTEAEVKAHLESCFVPYTKRTAYAELMYSNWMEEWIPIIVFDSMDSYKKKSASFSPFAVGTAVSVIGTFVGGPPGLAVGILTSLGIGISLTDTILDAVTIYRSAVYTYSSRRHGYAYDETSRNDYVKVFGYSATGELTGGYNSAGIFDWVISKPTTTFSNDCEPIAEKTLNNYEMDVHMNGFCTLYFPD